MERGWVDVPAGPRSPGDEPYAVHAGDWPYAHDGEAATIVCVHGLGGSHANWDLLAPRLARYGRVWAPDLAGFGLTDPAGRRATLTENLDLLAGFVRTVSAGPAVIFGNSMGGLLAIMLAARHPDLVSHLVVMNPALPPSRPYRFDPLVSAYFAAYLVPGAGEALLAWRTRKLTPAQQVWETMQVCTADPAGVDEEVLAAQTRLVARRRTMPHARPTFLAAARSLLVQLLLHRGRVWADVDAVRAPTLLIHGGVDRLIRVEAAQQAVRHRPDWAVRIYPDLGHLPMLEAPRRVGDDVEAWLTSVTDVVGKR